MTTPTEQQIALIGAGPSGLAGARCLQKHGIPFQGFEAHTDVGGLWNIHNPRSTVYQSAHLISSKRMTEFSEFPMPDWVADYPSQPDHLDQLRVHYDRRLERFAPNGTVATECTQETRDVLLGLREAALAAERSALMRLRDDGAISDEVLHRLEHELDIEALRLGIGERRVTG